MLSRLSFRALQVRCVAPQLVLRIPVTSRAFSTSGSPFLPAKEVEDRILTVLSNFKKLEGVKISASSLLTKDLGSHASSVLLS